MNVEIVALDEVRNIPGKYIVHIPGDHWVGLIIKKNYSMYFDSFGADVPAHILQVIPNVYAQSKQIQHTSSTMCGFYVLDFLREVKNLDEFKDYVDSWNDEPHLNAHQLKAELRQVIPEYMHHQFPDL